MRIPLLNLGIYSLTAKNYGINTSCSVPHVERNRRNGWDSSRGKSGFCSNFPHGFVLGLKVNEFLEVFGFGEGILLAKMIGLTDRQYTEVTLRTLWRPLPRRYRLPIFASR